MEHTWPEKQVPISVLLGLCIKHKATGSLWVSAYPRLASFPSYELAKTLDNGHGMALLLLCSQPREPNMAGIYLKLDRDP